MSAWHERFFKGIYGAVLPHAFSREKTLAQAAVIHRLLRLRKGERVLDLPCGQGRLTLPLARRGLRMVGVDVTSSYIAAAKRAGASARLKADFQVLDMRRLPFRAEFDAAFNFFASFGYFSDKQNLLALHQYHRALKPGGRLLIEGINLDWVRRDFEPVGDMQVGSVRIQESRRWSRLPDRILSTWTLTRGRRRESHRVSIRLYSPKTMRALLREAGFTRIRFHLSRGNDRYIALAWKPN